VKAVFDTKPNSGYDDVPASRYQFPDRSNYLTVVLDTVGDWVLYREPKRNDGREAYVAVAKLVRVEPNPRGDGLHYAHIAEYLKFPSPVPLKTAGRYAEAVLREVRDHRLVGASLRGNAIRSIGDHDFAAIVLAGLSEVLSPETAERLGVQLPPELHLMTPQPGFAETVERRVEQMLVHRVIREATFRLEVCRAYEDTCAVTGLKIVNGGGRAEVQAAHIVPVAAGGPDVVQNGIALSSTVHWLFDRHLISIDPDYRLLVAHNRVPGELRKLFRPEQQGLHLPPDRRLWPHPAFLTNHREKYAAH
jgi:putative restriction endonuclease